ncbi:hypothetical protein GGQ99_003856 [Aminobacter niigataensis]|uniref:Uncharacterized protein n=1 Tax=Aminobacter niigataensis TaxID=83265 RepID=A0ABR6L5J8_9HYPH|nr:hypothetical protein [Aminobacter niigataensis]MBB4652083.1 hypothetical protein [Aminobacter niigataensis]
MTDMAAAPFEADTIAGLDENGIFLVFGATHECGQRNPKCAGQ